MAGKRKVKRGRGRARRRNRRVMSVPRMTYGFEQYKMVKLTYADQIRLDPPSGGVPQSYVFSANSLYDPDYTSTLTGHRPLYYNEYSEIYANYKVYGSKITITGCNDYSDTANNTGNLIVCNITINSNSETSYTEAVERKNAKYKQCIQKRPFYLSNNYSAKKLHGIKDVKDALELQGLTGGTGTGSSPAQQAFYVLSAHPLFKGQDTYAALLNIKIEYIAMFFNMKRVQGS